MRSFDSIDGFLSFLATVPRRVEEARHKGLKEAGKHIEAATPAQFGVYQEAAGPFAAWPELADATKAYREADGYSPDEPELLTGELRDSVHHRVDAGGVSVGSDHPVMPFQEFGTSRIPPRSIIGAGLFRSGHAAAGIVAEHEVDALAGLPSKARPGGVR